MVKSLAELLVGVRILTPNLALGFRRNGKLTDQISLRLTSRQITDARGALPA
jgi:hypothetical protein